MGLMRMPGVDIIAVWACLVLVCVCVPRSSPRWITGTAVCHISYFCLPYTQLYFWSLSWTFFRDLLTSLALQVPPLCLHTYCYRSCFCSVGLIQLTFVAVRCLRRRFFTSLPSTICSYVRPDVSRECAKAGLVPYTVT